MGRKRGRTKLTTTAAIMWRISALVLGLWMVAMSYLTVMLAQDMYDHYEDHVQQYTAYQTFTEVGASVAEERQEMIYHAGWFDMLAAYETDIPLYMDPYVDESRLKRILMGDLRYDAAMVFEDIGTGQILFPQDLCAVEYMEEAEWFDGCETAEHYTYIDLMESDVIGTASLGQIDDMAFGCDMTRLTGYFEGDRFVVTDRDVLHVWYPGLLPKDLTLGQADAEGHLRWIEGYEGAIETDRETVRIYTKKMETYGRFDQEVTVAGQTFGSLSELAARTLETGEDLSRESLWDAVIVGRGSYRNVSGAAAPFCAAIRCYPMYTTILRLKWVYVLTLLPLAAILLLLRRRLRRELGRPLGQMLRCARQGFAPLPDTIESWWQEPYELEQWYVQIQQQHHALQQEDRRLRAALDHANDAERDRKRLISGLAHELKTPLAIVYSHCEGLEEGIAAEKRDQYLRIIRDEVQRMDGIVLELLDLSRLEAGKVRLQSDRFSLLELARSVFEELELPMEKKGQTVHFDLAEDFQITADEARIGQAIRNLATNAVKYTPEGGHIWVSVFRHKDQTVFTVENESAPLPEETLEKVWDSFYRASESRTEKGTGLGLTVVKTIIELHGGNCHAMNTQKGVQFGFRLP